jgi:hypothetical protein
VAAGRGSEDPDKYTVVFRFAAGDEPALRRGPPGDLRIVKAQDKEG